MGYKTLSVIVTDMATDGPTLRMASEIAEQMGAHLDVHCLGVDVVRYDPMAAGTAMAILEYGAEEARAQAKALVTWAATQILPGMTKVSIEPVAVSQLGLDVTVARLARYTDLIVASKPYDAGGTPLHVSVLEAALFGTGSPVLVVPASSTARPAPFGRIVCAWDESNESFNAIRAALPVLIPAKKVDIVMIDPPGHSPERSDPGGALALMLARYGVRPEVSILARTMPRIFDVIDRFATEHDADLVVMGAYGHSRFREQVFGGATRDTLEKTTRPILLAH